MSRLTNEEKQEIAIKYLELRDKAEGGNNEDIKVFRAYQNECAIKLRPLVLAHVAKYRRFSNYPDLEQEGFEALLMSLNTFDPSKGNFGYWARQYIKTRVCRAANAHSTIRIPIKKAKEMRPHKTYTIPMQVDVAPTPSESLEKSERVKYLFKAIDKLPEDQKKVISLVYGFGDKIRNTASEIMDELSLTRPQYTKLLHAAKDNIKKHMTKIEKVGDTK